LVFAIRDIDFADDRFENDDRRQIQAIREIRRRVVREIDLSDLTRACGGRRLTGESEDGRPGSVIERSRKIFQDDSFVIISGPVLSFGPSILIP
jgi:hypothetical protein